MTVRPLTEADRSALQQIARISFNVPPEWIRNILPNLPLDRYLGFEENGRLAGVAMDFELSQWFSGRAVPCSGVASVAVLPEHRAAGHASRLVEALMRRARRDGMPITSLYPATTHVYRGLGYELAGQRCQFRMRLAEIPSELPGEGIEIAESGLSDLAALKRCYNRFASRHTGPVECGTEDWWRRRVFRLWSDAPVRIVAAWGRGGGSGDEVEGYAAFQLDAIPGTWSYDIGCTHLVAVTPRAAGALLGYFRGFRGLGQSLTWYGPPAEPLAAWLGRGAEDVTPIRTQRFMTRLLDVPAALTARGWPDVTADADFAVSDPLFPENAGPWRIEASGGELRVSKPDGPPARTLSIGALSALYTGHYSVADAVLLGHLDAADPKLPSLATLFGGPAPWMPDIF